MGHGSDAPGRFTDPHSTISALRVLTLPSEGALLRQATARSAPPPAGPSLRAPSTVDAPVGASRFFGTLEVMVNRCAFHPPEEPPENAAFITIHDRGYNGLEPKLIFSGWIFSSSPAVSALEHPVYDLTLLACVDD